MQKYVYNPRNKKMIITILLSFMAGFIAGTYVPLVMIGRKVERYQRWQQK